MTLILILIVLGIVFWPVIKAGYRLWSQMRSMQRFMDDPVAEMQRRARQEERRQKRDNRRRAAADPQTYAQGTQLRKKKIPSDVGEYIRFTEIDTAASSDSCHVPPTIVAEQQIVDIEWEDIDNPDSPERR